MSNKKKITIGLDIGVSSVGWSILREDNVLIDYGSRLFPDAANAKDGKLENEARRSHRSMRRRIRRIKTRKNDLIKLLIKYNIISDQDELAKILEQGIVNETGNVPIVEIKYKGLKEKLSKEELLICLYHYIHKRGYFYITEEDLKENGENINRLPTEIQYDFYMKNGYYIGNEDNQKFSNLIWVKEIEKFLSKQSLDSNFVDEYISLFRRVRDYSDGPGSEKSPTP
ncbi:type II CRISPR RNA-guided endonuclease Cas9, partial [Malacoplasma iowae]